MTTKPSYIPSVFPYCPADSTFVAATDAYPYFYGYPMDMEICYRGLFYHDDKYLTDGSNRARSARTSRVGVGFPARAWLQIFL